LIFIKNLLTYLSDIDLRHVESTTSSICGLHTSKFDDNQRRGSIMIMQADFAAITALDLDRIKTKLCHVESGEGWSRARADAVEIEYRRFLYLMKAHPTEQTVPTVEVDIFWHYHILDTIKYAADCKAAFGYFLHHDPSVGLDGDSEAIERTERAARLDSLYRATFGPAAGDQDAYCGRMSAAYCGAARPAVASRQVAASVNVAAWCGMATSEKAAAWCGMATSEKAAAWCGMATSEKAAAWCGMATSEKAAAWCGMATSIAAGKVTDAVAA
jgi:hypothetical protein